MKRFALVAGIAAACILSACNQSGGGGVTGERIAAPGAGEWLSYGRTYDEQRFSPLDQINPDTVNELGLAWYADLPTNRAQEGTPLMFDGVLYATTSWSTVHAYDAATGKELWSYDPQVDKAKGFDACCDVGNRGVGAWGGNVYVATIDGRLVALDAKNGKVKWSVQTTDASKPYTITQAPRVVNGKVIVGNGGAEYGVRGYVSAYDAKTGKKIWRFYTTPNADGSADNEASDKALSDVAKTWPGEGWKDTGGGGTVWDALTYDPSTNLLYFGAGNGTPWNPRDRSDGTSDNLFLSSIVAVNADTGAYVWHYQVTPNDSWDFDADQQLMLADLPGDGGATRRVIMQASKNGFFYVLDAKTGAFISAKPFAQGVNWTSGIDASGRPEVAQGARYSDTPFTSVPGPYGAHNWHPMSYSPTQHLVYIPVTNSGFVFGNADDYKYTPGAWNIGISPILNALPDEDAQRAAIGATLSGALVAWDPVKQEERWSVALPYFWNGGTLATAGNLVFQGDAEGKLTAYTADTGKAVWTYQAGQGIIAAPMSYALNGEQYIALLVGEGGSGPTSAALFLPHKPTINGRLLVFKLGGTATAPKPEIDEIPPLDLTGVSSTGDPATGFQIYQSMCNVCHSANASGTFLPNLRRSPIVATEADFKGVVYDGAKASQGMAPFKRFLTPEQVEDVRAYIISQAKLHP